MIDDRNEIARAADMSTQWLKGEHTYQFQKGSDNFGNNLDDRLRHIMEVEIPYKWDRFKLFEEGGATDQGSQQLMKVVAATRAVAVLALSKSPDQQKLRSDLLFAELSNFHTQLVDTRIGSYRMFHQSPDFAGAVHPMDYVYGNRRDIAIPAFRRMAGVAVLHLCEMENKSGVMSLPEPGLTSGDIRPWEA